MMTISHGFYTSCMGLGSILSGLVPEGMTVDDFCLEPMAKKAGLGQPEAVMTHNFFVFFLYAMYCK